MATKTGKTISVSQKSADTKATDKNAAKTAAKKAAKKAPGQPDPQKPAKDARRTFEHLGRVQALAKLASSEREALDFLRDTADAAFQAQRYKESAELLRTAEHLSFATVQSTATETVAADLKKAITEEYNHVMEKAKERATRHEAPKALRQLFTRLGKDAKAALRQGSYRAALEFARGAEALSHVHNLGTASLPSATAAKQLQSGR